MAFNITEMLGLGGGGRRATPQKNSSAAATSTKSPATTPFNAALFQAQPTIMPQYTSGSWANLPTGMLGTVPAQQPAPGAPAPPSTGGGGLLGSPQTSQMVQRYPGLAQYLQGRGSSPLGSLFGGLFGRRA